MRRERHVLLIETQAERFQPFVIYKNVPEWSESKLVPTASDLRAASEESFSCKIDTNYAEGRSSCSLIVRRTGAGSMEAIRSGATCMPGNERVGLRGCLKG